MSDSLVKKGIRTFREEGARDFVYESVRYSFNRLYLERLQQSADVLTPEEVVAYSEDHGGVYRTDPDLAQFPHYRPLEDVEPDVEDDIDRAPRLTCVLPDARVIGGRGLVQTRDGHLIQESVKKPYYVNEAISETPHYFLDKRHLPGPINGLYRRTVSRPRHRSELALSLVTHGLESPNYGHWIVDYLSKLFHLERYEERTGREPSLIIDRNPPGWMTDSLDLLGYGSDRRVRWHNSVAQVDELLVPISSSVGTSSDDRNYSPIEFYWLRSKFLETVDVSEEEVTERVYITRQEYAQQRKVVNFDEIKPVLDKYDFRIIDPGEHPLRDQIKIFSQAEIVAGVSGAGLFNVLYSENTTLLELHTAYNSWRSFAVALGHSVTRISGNQIEETGHLRKTNELNIPITVDPGELERKIQAISEE